MELVRTPFVARPTRSDRPTSGVLLVSLVDHGNGATCWTGWVRAGGAKLGLSPGRCSAVAKIRWLPNTAGTSLSPLNFAAWRV
jgi:hypothetical protein